MWCGCWLWIQTLTGASVKSEGSPEEELMSRSSVCSWRKEIRQVQGAMWFYCPAALFILFYLTCSMKEVVQGLRIAVDSKETGNLKTPDLTSALTENDRFRSTADVDSGSLLQMS